MGRAVIVAIVLVVELSLVFAIGWVLVFLANPPASISFGMDILATVPVTGDL